MIYSEKTIDDVTREEWSDFAEAAIDLLGSARMMYWTGCHEKDEDRSHADALRRMEAAFVSIGLDQGNTSDFIVNLEHILRNGIPPTGEVGHA